MSRIKENLPYLTMEIPYQCRATINDLCDGVEIIIPVKKDWPIIVLFGIWLLGCFAVVVFDGNSLSGHDGFSNLVAVTGLLAGLCFSVMHLWWNFKGREVITVRQGTITIAKNGMISAPRSYELAAATAYFAREEPDDFFAWRKRHRLPWNLTMGGTIKFDFGQHRVKFGDRLSQAEGEYILDRLRAKKLIY